jgi:cell division protein FtsI (penicillin-binding protein 3)
MDKERFRIIKILFILVFPIILTFRLFLIQIWQHKQFLPYIEKQLTSKIKINIPRGDILDRNNKILATSVELAAVYINSKDFLEGVKKIQKSNLTTNQKNLSFICSAFNIPESELFTKCEKYKRFCLSKETDLDIAFKLKHIPGVEIETYLKRIYPYSPVESYIVGRINYEQKGYSGIEYEYENVLSNLKKKEILTYRSGTIQKNFVRLANIRELPNFINGFQNCSVVLTIDIELQNKISNILKKYYETYSPSTIMCIIQKSDTAELLVLSILPETTTPLTNPAISYIYEPGSVFKIFPLAVFLEERTTTPTEIIDCENGKFTYSGITITDVKPHKFLTVEDVIVFSSNIGMSKLYLKYANLKKFLEYQTLFGFGSPTGIEFSQEARGFLPSYEKCYPITPLYISFGQGCATTPLQIVNGYTMIANNGELLQPFVVKTILTKDKIIYAAEKHIIRKVISEKTANIIKEMLYQTVERGTAQKTKIDGIKICAKTGTAQKFDFQLQKYSPTKFFMSCCGFFPKENPQFTIGIFVDEPKGVSLASEIAVPIFKEVVLELLNYYNESFYAKVY